MKMVFLDTVGILALFDEDDQWHAAAVAAYERIRVTGAWRVTTPFILWECGNTASRRPYRRDVCELRLKLRQRGRLLDVTQADEESAWQAYQAGAVGDAGIVDHVSFEVMRRLGIIQAFSNDKHFTAAGFEVLF
jgi:predicted nucleic acid-binding protein